MFKLSLFPVQRHYHIITKGQLLFVIGLRIDSKSAYKQSLDSDKRCC